MLSGVAAIVSWILITGIGISIVWITHGLYILLCRYRVVEDSCSLCGHKHHADDGAKRQRRGIGFIEPQICAYNAPPIMATCERCKHHHSKHVGDSCGGNVDNYEYSLFGYKRELIDINKYKPDNDGIIYLSGLRPAYIHSDIRQITVSEPTVVGFRDVEYTESINVPTGKKQKCRIKKKRIENKQVAVEKIRKETRKKAPKHRRRAITETVNTTRFGIIENSHLARYIPSYSSSYGEGWQYKYVPARWGQIPTQTTQTRYIDEYVSSEEEVDVKYTTMEWQNVEVEYSTDEDVDVFDLKYVKRVKKEPITEIRNVKKQQQEYSFTCACKKCICARCVYKPCSCVVCKCKKCMTYNIAIYTSLSLPVITTAIFIGIIPIVFGIESTINGWPLLLNDSIHYGFVFIVLGISIFVSIIIVVLCGISERDKYPFNKRMFILAGIMWVIITIQLTSLVTFAVIPVIVWRQELSINVLPCYIIGGALITTYLVFWLVIYRFRRHIYKRLDTELEATLDRSSPSYGSLDAI